MTPREMKDICMQVALAPTAMSSRQLSDELLEQYGRMHLELEQLRGHQFCFTTKTSLNEDAMVVWRTLNELYPEG